MNITPELKELALREMSRRRLMAYVKYMFPNYDASWHHELMCEKLEQVEAGTIKRLMIFMPPRHGKACADSTPVLTPSGWKTHGELRVGDYVFGLYGQPIRVLAVSPKTVSNRRVIFSNGETIDCHENHEWTVFDRGCGSWQTYETKYFTEQTKFKKARQVVSGNRCIYQLPKRSAVEFSTKELPMDPYVLGAWLGDGTSGAPCITGDAKDWQIIDEVKRFYSISSVNVHKITGCLTTRFGSGSTKASIFGNHLRLLGVFNNKHIPALYKFSSVRQRLDLLAGLIDTDGHVDKNSRVRIITVSRVLAEDIQEVIQSLGWDAYITQQHPSLSTSGIQGKKIVYAVGFNPSRDIPTKLPRKKITRFPQERMVGLVSVEEVNGEVGNCIQVDSPDGLYLVGKNLIPTHNSELASVQFPAWYLGRNPNKEIIVTSYTADLATDFGRRVRNAIGSENYKNVFKTILSADSTAANKWHTTNEGSYISTGVGGPLTGRGADVLILDDVYKNRQEADSPVIRDQVWNWYISTAYTRLSPGGSVILVLTRWHDADIAGRLLAESHQGGDKWEVISLPAIATHDEDHRKQGEALWPTRFNLERLQATKAVLGSYDWASLYQQSPLDEDSIEFKREWFKYRTSEEVDKLNTRRFLTVDTAGPMTSTSDYTGWVDNCVDMEGNWNLRAKKYKISSADLVEMLFLAQDKYHYEKIGIEKTIYLDSLKPFLDMEMMKRKKMLPIFELKHGGRSKELRIRGILPQYQAGRVFHVKGECDDLEPQLLRFPKSSEDDVMDAAAYQTQIAETPFGWGPSEFANNQEEGVSSLEKFDPFNPLGSF